MKIVKDIPCPKPSCVGVLDKGHKCDKCGVFVEDINLYIKIAKDDLEKIFHCPKTIGEITVGELTGYNKTVGSCKECALQNSCVHNGFTCIYLMAKKLFEKILNQPADTLLKKE